MNRGFTLIEVVLATVISSMVITALVLLFLPYTQQFASALNFNQMRQKTATPLDRLRREVALSKAVYTSGSECFLFCRVDSTGAIRTTYFWENSDLKEKSEATSTGTVNCTGGEVIVAALDTAGTSFSILDQMLNINIKTNGVDGTSFDTYTVSVLDGREDSVLAYDGFECATVGGDWSLSSGTDGANWSVQASVSASGSYWLSANQPVSLGGGLNNTATADLSVNLEDRNQAYLKFKFRDGGTINGNERFVVQFFDGSTYNEVYREDTSRNVGTLEEVVIDLSAYTLDENSVIRFLGTLQLNSNQWYIDDIEVFVP